jgi:hypothetical protein
MMSIPTTTKSWPVSRVALTVLAYIGLAIIILTEWIMADTTINIITKSPSELTPHLADGVFPVGLGVIAILLFGLAFFGLVLALAGGFTAKPPYFWLLLILVGLFYFPCFSGIFVYNYKQQFFLDDIYKENDLISLGILVMLLGLACIISGILLSRSIHKSSKIPKTTL